MSQIQSQQAVAVPIADDAIISIAEIKNRLLRIQELLAAVMQEGVDFGTVPGCKKPSLWKPGAELICTLFRLAPHYEIQATPLPGGHREYEAICTLRHVATGAEWGQGVGYASSMESKHRYRGTQGSPTGRPVPRGYWDAKRANDWKQASALLGGDRFLAKKNPDNDQWEIYEKTAEKMENPDPADVFHTVKSMACKRAHVAAVRSATACSRIFDAEVEDDQTIDDPNPQARPNVVGKPIPNPAPKQTNGVAAVLAAFKPMNIGESDLVRVLNGKPIATWGADEIGKLRELYQQIQTHQVEVADVFGDAEPEAQTAPAAATGELIPGAAAPARKGAHS